MRWNAWPTHVIFASIGIITNQYPHIIIFKITFTQGANSRVQSSYHNHHPHRAVI